MSRLNIEGYTLRFGTLGGNEEEVVIIVLQGNRGWYWFAGIREVVSGDGPVPTNTEALRDGFLSAIQIAMETKIKGLYTTQWIEFTDYGSEADGVYQGDEGFEYEPFPQGDADVRFEQFLEANEG